MNAEQHQALLDLADRIDHEQLWRWAGMDHDKMTPEQKDRLNAGVALRRYAHLLSPGNWVVFPPTGNVHYSASTLDRVAEMARRSVTQIAAREQECWCNGSRNCGKPCHPDTGDAK